MSLLLLFRPSAGTDTPISGDDVGSGVDSQSIVVIWSQSDTGSGVDANTLAATLALSDTGSGADLHALVAALSNSDTGSGLDALLLQALSVVAEAGAGTEGTVGLSVSVVNSDTGSGGDGGTVDTGPEIPTDALKVDEDIAYSVDSVTNRTLQMDDSATAVEDQVIVYLVRILTDSDTAQGYEFQMVRGNQGRRPTLLSTHLSGKNTDAPH